MNRPSPENEVVSRSHWAYNFPNIHFFRVMRCGKELSQELSLYIPWIF